MLKLELHVRSLTSLKLELYFNADIHSNHGLSSLSQSVNHPAQILLEWGSVSLTLQAVHANPSPLLPSCPPPPSPLHSCTIQGLLLNVHIVLSFTGDEDMLWSQGQPGRGALGPDPDAGPQHEHKGKPGRHALGPDPDPAFQHEHRGRQPAAADPAEQWIGQIALPKVGIRTKLWAAASGGDPPTTPDKPRLFLLFIPWCRRAS